MHLTNAGWTVDAAAIGAAFGFRSVELVNDFVPVAASLSLGGEEKELVRIGPECPACPGARLVLGPGTGFGAAALLPMGERWAIHSTEAGHTDFGPAEPDEAALWPLLDRVAGRVTAEAVLSGPGLLRLYRALGQSRSAAAPCRTAEEVSAAALARDDALATAALQLFARLLGRFAGDLALTFGAGAVYLGGGIAPKIATVLSAGEFRSRLRAQGAVRALDASGADLPDRRSGPGADRPLRHPCRPRPLHVQIGDLATPTRLKHDPEVATGSPKKIMLKQRGRAG